MSASSPYQSQLFQRLTQQSHRWLQRWQQTLHRGKLAAVWGVQALLFPIYVLFQGAQRGAKRLRQAVPQPRAQLSAFGRHEQTGENRAPRLEAATPAPEALTATPASSGWLGPEPLAFIQSLLGQLRGLRAWQPSGLVAQGGQEPGPSIPETNDRSFLPAAPLSFVHRFQWPFPLPRVQPQRFLVRLDRAVAALEQQSDKLQPLWGGRSIAPPAAVGNEAFQIQTLIYAAIAYFFGRRNHSLPVSSAFASLSSKGGLQASAPYSLQDSDPSVPACSAPDGSQPLWITWHELFGRAANSVTAPSTPPSPSSPPRHSPGRATLPKSGFPAIPPIPGVSLVGDGINLEIDTEAVFMGYVEHPLRRILEWLDRFIAWVEKRLAAIWMNTRSFIAGFLGLPDRP